MVDCNTYKQDPDDPRCWDRLGGYSFVPHLVTSVEMTAKSPCNPPFDGKFIVDYVYDAHQENVTWTEGKTASWSAEFAQPVREFAITNRENPNEFGFREVEVCISYLNPVWEMGNVPLTQQTFAATERDGEREVQRV